MNPLISMGFNPPNPVAAYTGGVEAKGIVDDRQNQNALRGYIQQNGAGIMSGDQNALAGLGGMGPQGLEMAMGVQNQQLNQEATRQGMAIDQERLGMARQQAALQAKEYAARMSAAEAEQSAVELGQILDAVGVAYRGGPEAVERLKAQFGQNLPPEIMNATYDDVPMIAAWLGGTVEGLQPDTEGEREIQRMMTDLGMSRADAVAIKEGVVRPVQNAFGGTDFVNMQTRERVEMKAPTQPPADPTVAQAAPVPPVAPKPELGGGLGDASGISGALKGTANTISDTAGFGTPFQANAEVATRVRNIGTRVKTSLAAAIAGRPNVELVRMIDEMVAKPNAINMGEEQARRQMSELDRYLVREIGVRERLLQMGSTTPAMQAEFARDIASLTSLREDVQEISASPDSDERDAGISSDDSEWLQRMMGN